VVLSMSRIRERGLPCRRPTLRCDFAGVSFEHFARDRTASPVTPGVLLQ
jgi:hypothetical protein